MLIRSQIKVIYHLATLMRMKKIYIFTVNVKNDGIELKYTVPKHMKKDSKGNLKIINFK